MQPKKLAPTDAWRVGLVSLLVVVVLSAGTTSALADTSLSGTQQFSVAQGGNCTTVQPLGTGLDSVETFYAYKDHDSKYSSLGTLDIQRNQVSQLFLYHGTEGTSLVMLHDKFSVTGDAPGAGAATFNVTGLPDGAIEDDGDYWAPRRWAVEDDYYRTRDDTWTHDADGEWSNVTWVWGSHRTDGGAFRGLESDAWSRIHIDPAFNEESAGYPFAEWDGEPSDNHVEGWILRTGTGGTRTLDMGGNVTVQKGAC